MKKFGCTEMTYVKLFDKDTKKTIMIYDNKVNKGNDKIDLIGISPCLPPIASAKYQELISLGSKIYRNYKYNKRMKRTNELYQKRIKKYGKGL